MMFLAASLPRYVLMVGDLGTCLFPSSPQTKEKELYANNHDEAARRAIHVKLQNSSTSSVTVIMNGAAQEFRIETLPPVNIFDRAKLIERRLQQAFPQAFATAYRSLDATHALLTSVHQRGLLPSWCGLVPKKNFSLGLLPVEGAKFITQLVPAASKGWVLLLAHFKTGGLRQIVLCDGKLIFTRQSTLLSADRDIGMRAETLHRLVEDTRLYLTRFGFSDVETLQLVCLLGQDLNRELVRQNKFRHAHYLTPRQAAEKLQMEKLPAEKDNDADPIVAAWIAKQRKLWLPMSLVANDGAPQTGRFVKIGWRVALAVFLCAFVTVGTDVFRLVTHIAANRQEEKKIETFRAQLQTDQAMLAPAAEPLGRLRAALVRQRIFTEPQPEPWDVLRQLGRELDGKARLIGFDWRDDGSLQTELRFTTGYGFSNLDRQGIVQEFKNLAETLRQQMPDYRVEVVRYPFPAKPDELITNISSNENTSDVPTAVFLFRKKM